MECGLARYLFKVKRLFRDGESYCHSQFHFWHNGQVVELINELAAVASAEKKVEFDPGMEERLCSYSRLISHFPTAIKEVY